MTDYDPLVEEGRRQYEWLLKNREVLFANESFLIGVLQVVSGGSLFAGIAQVKPLTELVGRLWFLVFLTLMAAALIAAVLAAYFKHQYKMWDVKAAAAENQQLLSRRGLRANRFLRAMRWGMGASVAAIALAILSLLVASWVLFLWQGLHWTGRNAGSIPAHVSSSTPVVHLSGTH
jgi:hypothetical protein